MVMFILKPKGLHRLKTKFLLFLVIFCGACSEGQKPSVSHDELQRPTVLEAKAAIANMFGGSMYESILKGDIILGTCILTPLEYATKNDQISCTFRLKSPGGSSDSQADFYLSKKLFADPEWIATPSSSQEQLPFPDPLLHVK